MVTHRLSELVDLKQIRKLLDAQSDITGMPMGLLDKDGTILAVSGWREICTKFHRVHPETKQLCQAYHCGPPEEQLAGFKPCPNGLWDLHLPILVAGEHVATLMLGQFLFEGERPEEGFFRTQAERMGFDIAAYFEALSLVPTFSREKVHKLQEYTKTLVRFIAELGLQRLKSEQERQERLRAELGLRVIKAELEERVQERTKDIVRANEALRHSEDKFRNLVEQLSEGIIAVDLDARITYLNPRMAQLLGMIPEDLLGRPFVELMAPETQAIFLSHFETRKKGISETYEMPILHKNGHPVLFSVSGTPLKDRLGRMVGAFAVFSDITEKRKAEEALKESEAKFRSVFENMQDVFYRSDDQGRMVLMSPAGARMLGYDSVDELLGKAISESMYLVPANRARFLEAMSEKGYVSEYEVALRKKDGTPVIVSTNSHFYKDATGRILGVEGVFFDITDRKRAEEAVRESEAKYRRIVNHIRDIIYSYQPDGIISFISESVRRLGYVPEDIMGHSLFEFVHPDDQAEAAASFERAVERGIQESIECRLRRGDGEYEWFEEIHEPMYIDGVLVQVNGIVRNIMDRKATEESLKESEEMYRALVEHGHDGVYIFTGDHFLFVNRLASEICGYPLDELYGMNLWDLIHPEDRSQLQENAARRVQGEDVPSTYDARIIHKSGAVRYVEFGVSRVQFAGQWAVLGTVRDVTERIMGELALRESEKRYRLLVENQGEGVGYVDDQERILFVNRAAEELFGRSRTELLGRCLSEFTDRGHFQRIQDETVKRKTGEKSTYELIFFRPDGERRNVLVTVTPHVDEKDGFLGALGIFRDVTSVKQAESELKRLSKAIEQASDSILVADITGTIVYANPATERLLGILRPELEGQNIFALKYSESDEDLFQQRWQEALLAQPTSGRLSFHRADGSTGQTDTTLSPVRDDEGPDGGSVQYVVVTSRDVTREAELEAQLRHSQKMEAIGVLAGGIAHDFNNILMPILGYAELAQDRVGEDQPKLAGYLREIYNAGRRAADLVRQILTFSRQVEQVKKPVELHPIVKECLKLMRAAIPATIPIQASVGEHCGPVLADPSQIHQVVMNLCTNGYHAMRANGGRLEVCLDRIHASEPLQAIGGDLPSGDYVRISVSDTGCGMGPETQKKIFLPFFTTKKVGEGTGLGLSIVHGIITGSGGGITLDSEVGRGSTFTVYLPSAETPEAELQVIEEGLPSGTERIMVVDDEEPIGQMLGDMLQMLGYSVSIHSDSGEAIQAFSEDPDAYDLVLTDFTMPGMTGPELASTVLEIRPGLPVLLMTGYSEDLDEAKAKELGFATLLRKPLPLHNLAKAVRQTLDDATSGGA